MGMEMEKAFDFDFVFDTQFVFRKLLDAAAKPMTVVSIEKLKDSFADNAFLTALGCTLLDNAAELYVEKNTALADTISSLTLSKQTDIENADYIFLTSELNYETIRTIFEKAKKGTLADPHKSATIIISCRDFEGDEDITVASPGIKDEYMGKTSTYIKTILEIRQELQKVCDYPCGIDLFFISDKGEIFAYPRLARLVKLKKEAK